MPPKKAAPAKGAPPPEAEPEVNDDVAAYEPLPEWNQEEIDAEAFTIEQINASAPPAGGKGAPPPAATEDQRFEDPDGLPELPEELAGMVLEWKRPSEDVAPDENGNMVNVPTVMHPTVPGLARPEVTPIFLPAKNEKLAWIVSQMVMIGDYRNSIVEDEFLHELIWPKGEDGLPMYNPYGKYAVKVFSFGKWRKVIVDDRMPYDDEGENIFPESRTGPRQIWPALLCKAMFKLTKSDPSVLVNGFQFSYMFTRWCPQLLPIQPLSAWRAFQDYCLDEQTMVAVGHKSDATPEEVKKLEGLGLKPRLAYQVMEARTALGVRVLRLKSLSARWTEKYSDFDTATWTTDLQEDMDCSLKERLDAYNQNHDFWISYNDFLTYFAELYIHRSPAMYKYVHYHEDLKFMEHYPSLPTILHGDADTATHMLVCLEMGANDITKVIGTEGAQLDLINYSWTEVTSMNKAGTIRCHSVDTRMIPIPQGPMALKMALNARQYDGFAVTFYLVEEVHDWAISKEEEYLGREDLDVKIRDEAGVYRAMAKDSWAFWFHHVIKIDQPTFMSVGLHTKDPQVQPYTRLQLVNNDTGECESFVFLKSPARVMEPNENGYTLLADSAHSNEEEIPPGRYVVRVCSTKPIASYEQERFLHSDKLEGEYASNRYQELFKYKVVPSEEKSFYVMRLRTNKRSAKINLALYDNGEKVKSTDLKFFGFLMHALKASTADEPHDYVLVATVSLRRNGPVCVKNPLSEEDAAILEGLKWDVDIHATTPVTMTPDTTRADHYTEIRGQWEAAAPGRATKAKETRTIYHRTKDPAWGVPEGEEPPPPPDMSNAPTPKEPQCIKPRDPSAVTKVTAEDLEAAKENASEEREQVMVDLSHRKDDMRNTGIRRNKFILGETITQQDLLSKIKEERKPLEESRAEWREKKIGEEKERLALIEQKRLAREEAEKAKGKKKK